MTNLEFLKERRQWAIKWLAKPESELPGTLSHAKCHEILESVEDKMLDYLAVDGATGKMIFSEI